MQDLWTDPAGERFYRIPPGRELPPGPVPIHGLHGAVRSTTAAELERHAIPAGAARGLLRERLRPVVEEAFALLGGAPPGAAPSPPPAGSTRAPGGPAGTALAQLDRALESLLERAPGTTGEERRGARDLLRTLRRSLAARGERTPAEGRGVAPLPELLDLCRAVAGRLTATEERLDLDAVASSLETGTRRALGAEEEAGRVEEERLRAHRAAARRSIAASLRRHGITPLSARPDGRAGEDAGS